MPNCSQYSPEAAVHNFFPHRTSKPGLHTCVCEKQRCVHAVWASACCSVMCAYLNQRQQTGCSSWEPHAEEGIKSIQWKCGACIKECITADREEREGKKETNNRESQSERKVGRDACRGIVFWGFDFPINAEEEEMRYSAVDVYCCVLFLRGEKLNYSSTQGQPKVL